MGNKHEFKIFDFQAEKKRRQEPKESNAQYEYIKSKCQIGNVELFDSLIDEVELTEAAAFSVLEYMKTAHNKGFVATKLFSDSVLLHEDEFYNQYGINWWITIEDALIYFAMTKQKDEASYRQLVEAAVHPN